MAVVDILTLPLFDVVIADKAKHDKSSKILPLTWPGTPSVITEFDSSELHSIDFFMAMELRLVL